MNERVIEIIVYIVNEMRTTSILEDSNQFQNLSQKLSDDGYTESEINFAFSWILEKVDVKDGGQSDHSYRILHDFEKVAISPAAYGYLIQLRELDLIDDVEMEHIIEKALLSDSNPVSVSEVKEIVSSLILKPDDIMEGSFFMLDTSYNVH